MLRFACLLLVFTGCVAPSAVERYDLITARLGELRVTAPTPDAELEKSVTMASAVARARSAHPGILAARGEARAKAERIVEAAALGDPRLRLEANVTPEALTRETIGLRQMFPFPGKLSAKGDVAAWEAERAFETAKSVERHVIAEARRAWLEYALAVREQEIHKRHIALGEESSKTAETRYRNAEVEQQDVLKMHLEQVNLDTDARRHELKVAFAKAALNRQLGRSGGAPLGDPAPLPEPVAERDLAPLRSLALSENPELRMAEAEASKARASKDLADREAGHPDFDLGVEFLREPGEKSAWGAMIELSLPWLNSGKRAAVRASAEEARAAESRKTAAENDISTPNFEQAAALLASSRQILKLIRADLQPKAKQAFEVAQSQYGKGRASLLEVVEAQRSLLDAELGELQAHVDVIRAYADLEEAAGRDLDWEVTK